MAKSKELMLRGKPVTMFVGSGILFFQINGFDMVVLHPVNHTGIDYKDEPEFKKLTSEEFQAIIDHIAQVFPCE